MHKLGSFRGYSKSVRVIKDSPMLKGFYSKLKINEAIPSNGVVVAQKDRSPMGIEFPGASCYGIKVHNLDKSGIGKTGKDDGVEGSVPTVFGELVYGLDKSGTGKTGKDDGVEGSVPIVPCELVHGLDKSGTGKAGKADGVEESVVKVPDKFKISPNKKTRKQITHLESSYQCIKEIWLKVREYTTFAFEKVKSNFQKLCVLSEDKKLTFLRSTLFQTLYTSSGDKKLASLASLSTWPQLSHEDFDYIINELTTFLSEKHYEVAIACEVLGQLGGLDDKQHEKIIVALIPVLDCINPQFKLLAINALGNLKGLNEKNKTQIIDLLTQYKNYDQCSYLKVPECTNDAIEKLNSIDCKTQMLVAVDGQGTGVKNDIQELMEKVEGTNEFKIKATDLDRIESFFFSKRDYIELVKTLALEKNPDLRQRVIDILITLSRSEKNDFLYTYQPLIEMGQMKYLTPKQADQILNRLIEVATAKEIIIVNRWAARAMGQLTGLSMNQKIRALDVLNNKWKTAGNEYDQKEIGQAMVRLVTGP